MVLKTAHGVDCLMLLGSLGFKPKEDVGDKLLFSGITVLLVLVAGLMSGLTLGLLSISRTDIEVNTFFCIPILT